MTLIIPGVEVKVVKDVVAPQLAPSGVLGLVGLTEKQPTQIERASSWSRFVELFGPSTAYSLPEAGQALANGVFELVVVPVKAAADSAAKVSIAGADGSPAALTLTARAPGIWANKLAVTVVTRKTLDDKDVFDVSVQRPDSDEMEVHRNLSIDKDADRNAAAVINAQSLIVRAQLAAAAKLPKAGGDPAKSADSPYKLDGGKDAAASDYRDALAALENEPDVDMVLVAVQDLSNSKSLATIYSDVISHCERMSAAAKGRIGFGEVTRTGTADSWTELAANLVSDRFVMVAPHGVAGAVAGRIGSLDYYESPTFKTLSGIGNLPQALGVNDQQALLKANIVPVVTRRGRGTIIVRGLTTDGDQISVRRVADHAVRGVKSIGELFIGRLNNEQGRGALKQKVWEFLLQMEKDGAIVPSTDGTDPAFKVNVYSSQDDFSKGIVRIDLAVRPVRAIDYIYATILVQV